ncbi:dienelactone hydrolase family protein [Enhydrobacter sp.]|jgi:dienelactone hydrolase|uniref:dienelactone hydrolase family protein n=1 Tax=Enhydrobacter sp. TaxID=1894999 RepID=UPI0026194330|nr:dienelactone hydrolase family protein [Enhydrobacter sp.]
MESVSFDTLTFDHPTACRPARVTATLHLPTAGALPCPCMVILSSSAGVQRHREHYYAQALNDAGTAALVIDSFGGRGVRRTVADQSLVSAAQMEGDALAALALLRSDPRLDPGRIGVMGVSKGGGATLNAAIAVRQRWRNGFTYLFDLHVAICPGATSQHRDPTTHGRPIYFMLAGRDDYTPAPLAIEYAERMRAAGNRRIRVKVYGGAHHGWESVGPVFDIKDAENWSCCRNFIEDDGRHFVPAAGRTFSEPDYQAWARLHCVTRGARAGGGTVALKQRATADLLDFLALEGFAPQWTSRRFAAINGL